MISKEKKAAIMAEYGRTPRRYRITGSTDRNLNSKNPGAHRASEREPEGSSFQKRTSENGWSETWYACLPSENRSGRLSCTDRKIRHQKIITG